MNPNLQGSLIALSLLARVALAAPGLPAQQSAEPPAVINGPTRDWGSLLRKLT